MCIETSLPIRRELCTEDVEESEFKGAERFKSTFMRLERHDENSYLTKNVGRKDHWLPFD